MTSLPPSTKIDGRIFVVGVPRSGTTLVQSLLAAHSTTTSFTESHFFDKHLTLLPLTSRPILTRNPEPRLQEFLAENGEEPPESALWFSGQGRASLRARVFLPFRTRQVTVRLLRVLDELALDRGKTRWIEKTPRHLRYTPFLDELSGPETPVSFVHVIRGGLEVVASLHQASQSWERPYDLEACVRRWNADVGFSLSRVGAPNDHFVFYEELTTAPEATTRRLFDVLGLAWEPEVLERYAGTSDRLVTSAEEAWKANVGRGIRPSATSGRVMTEEDRQHAVRTLRRDLYEELRERVREASRARGVPA